MSNVHIVSQGLLMLELQSTTLSSYDQIDLSKNPYYKFVPGDRYIVIGKESYDHIVKVSKLHLGLRNEGYFECTKMQFLRTRDGVILKFSDLEYEKTGEWLDEASFNGIKSKFEIIKKKIKDANLKSGISKRTGRPWYRFEFKRPKDTTKFKEFLNPQVELPPEPKLRSSKVIRDSEMIDKAFNYFDNYEGYIGLDYETGGIPFEDHGFEIMGVGLATQEGIAAYFDMEYMEHIGGNYEHFKTRYLQFLRKRQNQIYTYNVGFELRVTYLMYGEFFNFHDAAALNYIEGNHFRRYSLKYTAINYLHVASWDDDFDYLCWKLDLMMNGYKNKKEYIPPIPKDQYESCDHWHELCAKYPNDIDEFKRLLNQSWGNQYKCIPSRILGGYCNLDAFHTALIRKASDELGYSETCWDTFSDNTRMAAHLHMSGFHQDTKFKDESARKAQHYLVFGQYNAVVFYLNQKLRRFNLDKYSLDENLQNLLMNGVNVFNSKAIVIRYLNEEYEFGMDESKMLSELGMELSSEIIDFLKKRYQRMDRSILRQRNIFNDLDIFILSKFGFGKNAEGYVMTDGSTLPTSDYEEVRDYYTTLKIFNNLRKMKIGANDIQDEYVYDGNTYTPAQFLDYLKGILNLSSSVPYDCFIRNVFLSDPYIFIYVMSAHRTKTQYGPGVLTRKFSELELADTQKELYEQMKAQFDNTFNPLMDMLKQHKDRLIENKMISSKSFSQYMRSGEIGTLCDEVTTRYADLMKRKAKDPKTVIPEYLAPPRTPKAGEKLEPIDNYNEGLYPHIRNLLVLIKSEYWIICCAGTHFYHQVKWDKSDTDLLRFDDGTITCLDRRIVDYWKLAYGVRVYRKFIKNYGTYLTGLLCENQTTCNPPDKLGISTQKHYDGPDKIIKCYPAFNEMQVKSKRWSAGEMYACTWSNSR